MVAQVPGHRGHNHAQKFRVRISVRSPRHHSDPSQDASASPVEPVIGHIKADRPMLGSDPRSGFSEPALYFRFRQTGIGAAFDPDWNTWDTPTRAICKHSVVRFWLGAFAIGPGCRFISRAFSRSHRRSRLRPNRVRNGLAAGGEWIGTFSSARDRQRLRGFIRVGATTRRIIRALVGLNTANQWRCSAASREPPPVVERRRPRHRRWRGIAELKVRIHCPPAESPSLKRELAC